MKILGIYDGHNSHACVQNEGEIIASVEEERYSRIKNHDGRLDSNTGPIEATKFCINQCGNIDAVAIALADPNVLQKDAMESFHRDIDVYKRKERLKFLEEQSDSIARKYPHVSHHELPLIAKLDQEKRILKLKLLLKEVGLEDKPIHFVDHHFSHVASSYYTAPFDDVLLFSLDGKGDDLCGMVALGNQGKIKVQSKVNYIHSIGHFYSAITVVCGFSAIRHEGKITGLAALGVVNSYLQTEFEKLFYFDYTSGTIVSKMADGIVVGPYPHTDFGSYIEKMAKICTGFSKEDISCNAQYLLEKIVLLWVNFWVEKLGKNKIVLSGGIFSNVKLNQRIAEIMRVKQIYVVPAMTDAGLGWGASFAVHYQSNFANGIGYVPKPLKDVFLGPSYSDAEIIKELVEAGLEFSEPLNIELEMAKLLSEEKIVARFDGRLEYGPRSLGNRSILFSTKHQRVNDQLNIKLKRSEFMPFAPASLIEHASELYESASIEKMSFSAQFMTISVLCTDKMLRDSPSTVHKDRTARPQLVDSESNPGFYKILKNYFDLTGIASVGNTSFNLHEEPIVCSPKEAIRSYIQSDLDALQLGKFMTYKK
jgi:carbamoyltransferase